MKNNNLYKVTNKIAKLIFTVILLSPFLGCEDFLEPETPLGQIESENVFADENTATAAIATLYGKFRDQALLTGNFSGVGFSMGLYADELDYYGPPGNPLENFYLHQVLPSNSNVKLIWDQAYSVIYGSNAALEGITASETLAPETKEQLTGEALFVRALAHFYLVNLFGEIPYITTTEYTQNSVVQKIAEQEVYAQIIEDLLQSKAFMNVSYPSSDRVRPNKSVASALLARVYLYTGQWQNAESESSLILNNGGIYALEQDLNNVFLKESPSTIWQLRPKSEGENTIEATVFIFNTGPPPLTALTTYLINSIEEGDLRKSAWINEVTNGMDTWYHAYKYKQNLNTGSSMEYAKVFRLAELYLIRAEARTMLGDIEGAQKDLNMIRNRAGLADTPAGDPESLREAILRERQIELFTEFGHRWFDLKRSGHANDVLSSIKPGWKPTDVLLPLPENELLMNPNLNPQNPGY